MSLIKAARDNIIPSTMFKANFIESELELARIVINLRA